jgi:KDO2-lipid IV(A) lauroyltransferase
VNPLSATATAGGGSAAGAAGAARAEASPTRPEPLGARLRGAAASFWLAVLFLAAERAPGLLVLAKRPFCRVVYHCSPWVRRGTLANARRLLPGAPPAQVTRLARRTLHSFYLFCCDVGRSLGRSREDLLARIESTRGHPHFAAARAAGRGVIVVTAHMGSFEVGMAALREVEKNRIHVVFRRDRSGRFERQRSALRARIGVEEAPVDEGWTVWVRLRDALLADEAVVLQGDRVMPGQRGEPVPFLGGTLLLPSGPIKLALATGAPIVPIFSVRTAAGKVRLFVEPPIDLSGHTAARGARDGARSALLEWAAVLERYVRAYPDQWLLLEPALVEDKPGDKPRGHAFAADAKDGADEPPTS